MKQETTSQSTRDDERTLALRKQLSDFRDLGQQIVSEAKKGGASVAECVLRTGAELATKVRMGETELVEEAGQRGAGLRVIKDGRVALTSTSDLSPQGIKRFIQDALELAELSQKDEYAGPADPNLLCDPNVLTSLDLYDPAGGAIDAKRAIELAKAGEHAALSYDPRITNSDGSTFGRTAGGSVMVFSSGFVGESMGSYQSLSIAPIADDAGGKKRQGSYWTAKRHLSELESSESVGLEAAKRTLRRLSPRKIKTGEYPVIFDTDAARSMLGLLASCVMGSSIWRKSSFLIDKEGKQIAHPSINVVDDPLILKGPGSRSYDGEGLASRKNVVVENGVLRTYLCDSYSARKLGRQSTASASRSGSSSVSCGISNFILQKGDVSPEDLISTTQKGFLVTDMMGFGFNAVTGDFSRGASGFWIEAGEIAYPVSEVTISLHFGELLQRIDALCSDLDLRTSMASPTFRVSKMTVAGES